jgi:hypothetical protein
MMVSSIRIYSHEAWSTFLNNDIEARTKASAKRTKIE